MKVCVFGAGAIGGLIAARLAQAPGVTVSVVARGAHLAAIRGKGHSIRAMRELAGVATPTIDEVYALLDLRVAAGSPQPGGASMPPH